MGHAGGQVDAAEQWLQDPSNSANAWMFKGPDYSNIQKASGNIASGSQGFTANSGAVNNAMGQQQGVFNQLQNIAQGKGPSVAQQQMNQGLNQAAANAQSAALGSQAGVTPGMTQRNILNAMQAQNTGVIAQGGLQRAQEQQAALGQMGGVSNQMTQGQLGLSQQGIEAANASQQNQLAALSQQQQMANAQYQANLNQYSAKQQYGQAMYGAQTAQNQANASNWQGLGGTLLNAAGLAAGGIIGGMGGGGLLGAAKGVLGQANGGQ